MPLAPCGWKWYLPDYPFSFCVNVSSTCSEPSSGTHSPKPPFAQGTYTPNPLSDVLMFVVTAAGAAGSSPLPSTEPGQWVSSVAPRHGGHQEQCGERRPERERRVLPREAVA